MEDMKGCLLASARRECAAHTERLRGWVRALGVRPTDLDGYAEAKAMLDGLQALREVELRVRPVDGAKQITYIYIRIYMHGLTVKGLPQSTVCRLPA